MEKRNHTECTGAILPVRDALEILSGKWKLPILISMASGNKRFREIERSIPKINPKVLAKELKDLEQNKLIIRNVHVDIPVTIEYTLTKYANSLQPVIKELSIWGENHRKMIIEEMDFQKVTS